MLFDRFKIPNPKAKAASFNIPSSWRVAWGKVDSILEEVTWRDDRLAMIAQNRSSIFMSRSQQFVIIGDLWLSNQLELLQKLGLESSPFSGNNGEIIAQAWSKWQLECLPLLKGIFAFVVWDRDRQILYCVRDSSGARTLYCTTNHDLCWISPQLRTLAPYRSQEIVKPLISCQRSSHS